MFLISAKLKHTMRMEWHKNLIDFTLKKLKIKMDNIS